MIGTDDNSRATRRGMTMAGIAAGMVLMLATAASAGVTDNVLTSIDLAKEAVKLNDRMFRLRRLEVQPGGVVPMHSHGDRPALIYIVSGTITEYSSNCTVPVVHKAGEAAMESVGLTHWWKNTGSEVSVLISADLLHTKKEDGQMM